MFAFPKQQAEDKPEPRASSQKLCPPAVLWARGPRNFRSQREAAAPSMGVLSFQGQGCKSLGSCPRGRPMSIAHAAFGAPWNPPISPAQLSKLLWPRERLAAWGEEGDIGNGCNSWDPAPRTALQFLLKTRAVPLVRWSQPPKLCPGMELATRKRRSGIVMSHPWLLLKVKAARGKPLLHCYKMLLRTPSFPS